MIGEGSSKCIVYFGAFGGTVWVIDCVTTLGAMREACQWHVSSSQMGQCLPSGCRTGSIPMLHSLGRVNKRKRQGLGGGCLALSRAHLARHFALGGPKACCTCATGIA